VGWLTAGSDILGCIPEGYDDGLSRFAAAVAICCTAWLMMQGHQRPIGKAYELGYQAGRRDQMVEANSRPVSQLRPAGGRTELARRVGPAKLVETKRIRTTADA